MIYALYGEFAQEMYEWRKADGVLDFCKCDPYQVIAFKSKEALVSAASGPIGLGNPILITKEDYDKLKPSSEG